MQDLNNKLTDWQLEMQNEYLKHCRNKSCDLTDLYLKLNCIADKYISDGTMQEGEKFYIDLGMYGVIRLDFYQPYGEIYLKDDNSNGWELLLEKRQSSIIEYNNVLTHYSQLMHANGLCIGDKYPEELIDYFSNARPGEMLRFKDGKTYVCAYNERYHIGLRQISIAKLTNENFADKLNDIEEISWIDAKSLQKFYQKNRTDMTGSVEVKKINIDFYAQEYINKVWTALSEHKQIDIKIGPIDIVAQKNFTGKGINWYDDKGKKISEDTVKYALGYYKNTPVSTIYSRRADCDSIDKAKDIETQKKIEQLIKQRDFQYCCTLSSLTCA